MPRSNAADAPDPRKRAHRPTGASPVCGNKPSGTGSATNRRPIRGRRRRCNKIPSNREPTVRPRTSPTRSGRRRAIRFQCRSRGLRPSPSPRRPPNRRNSVRLSKTTWRPGPPYRRRRTYWDRGIPRPAHPAPSYGRSPPGSANRRYTYNNTSRRACAGRSPWHSSTIGSAARG